MGGDLDVLLSLISQGQKLAYELRKCKDRHAAKTQYGAWRRSVKEHLKDSRVATARFFGAQPIAHVRAGMAFGVAGYWQHLQGELTVLIAIAREWEQHKPDELFTVKPSAFGITANLKEFWRRDKADLQKWWARLRNR
jgi:hypothetical protein